MVLNRMFLDKFEQRLCVQDKENGPQDWALGNARTVGSFVWSEAINCKYLSSVWKIWSEPRQSWVTDTKSMFESVKKNVIIYGIECSSVKMQTLPLSRAVRRSFTIFKSAVSVLWSGLYADWRGLKSLFEIRWSFSWERTFFPQWFWTRMEDLTQDGNFSSHFGQE